MDHGAAAMIPLNYESIFLAANAKGQVETLLKESIIGGALYENVILMLLQGVSTLPEKGESHLGSRQSLRTAAKVQVVKSYKQKDPILFARLMSAIKGFFPRRSTRSGCCM